MEKPFLPAKDIFFRYRGDHFQMAREGEYETYKSFCVPKETEAKWYKEMLDGIMTCLSTETNHEKIGNCICAYCCIVCEIKSADAFHTISQYMLESSPDFDTFTLLWGTESVFDALEKMPILSVHAFKCCSLAKGLIRALEDNMQKGISVSEDYMHGDATPDYLTPEAIALRASEDKRKWKAILRRRGVQSI